MTGSVGQDVVQLATEAWPFVGAALGAYGARVLDHVEDDAVEVAADATAGVGRRVLRLILRRKGPGAAAVVEAVRDAVAEPGDEDAQAALRQQVKKALRDDTELRAEVARLLGSVSGGDTITAVGERSVAARTISGSTVITGDGHPTR